MSSALLRRLAPLSLFAVPLLIPVLISASDAAGPARHHHKHHGHTHSAATPSATGATTTTHKATARSRPKNGFLIPAAARNVMFGTSLGRNAAQTFRLFPNARIGRVYWQAPKAKLPALPSSYAIWLSFKTSPSLVASGRLKYSACQLLRTMSSPGSPIAARVPSSRTSRIS